MPHPEEHPSDVLSQIRDMLGLREPLRSLSLESLQRYTRAQLLDCARRVGLTGLSRLTKSVLAERFQAALATLGLADQGSAPTEGDATRKFDLGLPREPRAELEHIPWGYGQDRVTAMVIDPERLYVYWEVTDEAIARARERLGAGGEDAWLGLRIYDVTGRLFDGTNAHGYFDHRVERTDRQWFFHIGRPGSTVVVELGLKSLEGYFVRVARSGRADFPRVAPAPPHPVEWLTVRTASGAVEPAYSDASRAGPTPAGEQSARGHEPPGAPPRVWDIRRTHGEDGTMVQWTWERAHSWYLEDEGGAWYGPIERTSWEAGPFTHPVAPPAYAEERWAEGVSIHRENGHTRVIHGPWRVVIRGLGGFAERRVLAVWEIARSWVSRAAWERQAGTPGEPSVGASELLAGASERRRLWGSEVRLGGASELYRLGASELRLGGASELRLRGASELRLAGASERRLGGASELRLTGASERRLGGASEVRARGASERRLGGASAFGRAAPVKR